jgi:uncharacterized protein (DUF1330 family)
MKTRYAVALSVVAGVALGAGAVQVLHAQTKPKAYIIVENVINDQNGYMKDCAPAMAKSNEDAGAKFLVRGGQLIAIHGAPPPGRVVVAQFDSLDKAQAWVNSPATKALFDQCEKYATLHDYLVEGVPQ